MECSPGTGSASRRRATHRRALRLLPDRRRRRDRRRGTGPARSHPRHDRCAPGLVHRHQAGPGGRADDGLARPPPLRRAAADRGPRGPRGGDLDRGARPLRLDDAGARGTAERGLARARCGRRDPVHLRLHRPRQGRRAHPPPAGRHVRRRGGHPGPGPGARARRRLRHLRPAGTGPRGTDGGAGHGHHAPRRSHRPGAGRGDRRAGPPGRVRCRRRCATSSTPPISWMRPADAAMAQAASFFSAGAPIPAHLLRGTAVS